MHTSEKRKNAASDVSDVRMAEVVAEAATAVTERTAAATPRDKIFFILFSSINFFVYIINPLPEPKLRLGYDH